MNRRHALLALALTLGTAQTAWAADANTVYLQTKDGRITIELRPDLDMPERQRELVDRACEQLATGNVFR